MIRLILPAVALLAAGLAAAQSAPLLKTTPRRSAPPNWRIRSMPSYSASWPTGIRGQ